MHQQYLPLPGWLRFAWRIRRTERGLFTVTSTCGGGEDFVILISPQPKPGTIPSMSAIPKKRTRRVIASAYEKAKNLGPLVPMEPANRRSDGSPKVGPGQVYVTETGEVFHPAWCSAVGNVWDNNSEKLLVIEESTVGTRRQCATCDEPLQA